MKEIPDFFAKSNLFIALGAASLVVGAFSAFQLSVDWSLSGFVFFATLFTYNFQRRIGDLRADRHYSKTEWTFMAIGLAGMSWLSFELETIQLPFLIFSGILSILYAYPIIPAKRGKVSLRQLPYLKLWLIVIVWIIGTSVPPLVSAVPAGEILLYALMQGALVAALTIPFDLRDMDVDLPEQRTIPQLFGVKGSKIIALAMLLISLFLCVAMSFQDFLSFSIFFDHLVVSVISAVLILTATPARPDLFFSLLIDGMLLLQGVLFWLI